MDPLELELPELELAPLELELPELELLDLPPDELPDVEEPETPELELPKLALLGAAEHPGMAAAAGFVVACHAPAVQLHQLQWMFS